MLNGERSFNGSLFWWDVCRWLGRARCLFYDCAYECNVQYFAFSFKDKFVEIIVNVGYVCWFHAGKMHLLWQQMVFRSAASLMTIILIIAVRMIFYDESSSNVRCTASQHVCWIGLRNIASGLLFRNWASFLFGTWSLGGISSLCLPYSCVELGEFFLCNVRWCCLFRLVLWTSSGQFSLLLFWLSHPTKPKILVGIISYNLLFPLWSRKITFRVFLVGLVLFLLMFLNE